MSKICPKCSGEMEKGLAISVGIAGAAWKKESVVSKLCGKLYGPKISAYKCKNCGFVENYAEKY